jgi:hypothetical protein
MSQNGQAMLGTEWTVDRAKKYGWSPVAASEVYACFEEVVAAAEPTFTSLKKGSLVRQDSSDFVSLIRLCAGKGATYSFRWGLSLAFLPHEWEPGSKYHRTLKSARFDLWENPSDFLVADAYSGEDLNYLVDSMHGAACMRQDMQRAWSKLQPTIKLFFESCATLEGVLLRAHEHSIKDWQSFRHWPDPKMVEAFTLARLRRVPEAESLLRAFVAENKSIEAPNDLLAALKEISI